MDLGRNWEWETRKLACKIRPESGNPAIDELRQQLAELTGVSVPDATTVGTKKPDKGPSTRKRSSSTQLRKSVTMGSLKESKSLTATLGASNQILANTEDPKLHLHEMNINKRFFKVPRSPPLRIVTELQNELMRSATASSTQILHPEETPEQKQKRMEERRMKRAQRQKLSKRPQELNTPKEGEQPPPPVKTNAVFKPYQGDVFGTGGNYMGGMVYLSRLPTHNIDTVLHHRAPKRADAAREACEGDSRAGGSLDVLREAQTQTQLASSKSYEAKLHCAQTLVSWSSHAENGQRLADEGGVEAIMILCKEEDIEIRKLCAEAMKLMSISRILSEKMIDISAVPIISELANQTKDFEVARDCAVTLVNLTRMDNIEARLVEDGIVLALMSIMNHHDTLATLCAKGLFNLTCVDSSYVYVERVIKSFVALASSATQDVKHICASGLCNLSDLKPLKGRIVEEGVVQCIGTLIRGAEPKTRRVCAIIMHTLALSPSCRADMVSKGAVQTLYSLSSDEDPITLHYVASAIIRLALVESNLTRLINESGVIAICNIAQRCPRVAITTQLCSAALQLLSQHTIGQPAIVQEGCTPALVILLRESTETSTLRHSLAALCNLLTSEDNHIPIIHQGAVQSIIQLCGHENSSIREACALALFNLSRGEATRDHHVNFSAIPAIIALSRQQNPLTQMRCAAALCKLASNVANVPLMVENGVVPAFIEMLKTEDAGIVKHCCSALCSLAHEGSSCVMIAEGAVPFIIKSVEHGDETTQQACCAVLSIISSHEQCRRQLCKMGALPALIELAKMDHTITRLRCAVAFANLSFESTVQGEMVDNDIISVVADLSSPSPCFPSHGINVEAPTESQVADLHDSSYSEENQLYCAKAICNLSCHAGSETKIVAQGGVAALMMICMVRAVNQFTKQVCAKALVNLLIPENIERLLGEDLVQAMSALSKRPQPPKKTDETLLRVCAEVFCTLSAHPVGRAHVTARVSTLENIFSLMRSRDSTTQALCGQTTCNLLSWSETQQKAVEAGAVAVLKQMCTSGDLKSEISGAKALFLISSDPRFRSVILQEQIFPVLVVLSQSNNRDTMLYCNKTACNLAQHASTRAALVSNGMVSSIVAISHTCEDEAIMEIGAYSLALLALEKGHEIQIVDDDALGALRRIASLHLGLSVTRLVVFTVYTLSKSEEAARKLVADGCVDLITRILGDESSQQVDDKVYTYCASALYNFSQLDEFQALALRAPRIFQAMAQLGKSSKCQALVAASLCLLASMPASRAHFIENGFASLLLSFAASADEATVVNCSRILLHLSRSQATKSHLVDSGVVPTLIKLSKSSNEKIRSNSSEALKNLSSSGGNGIEEGTVSTLISMSLTGGGEGGGAIDEAQDSAQQHEVPVMPQTSNGHLTLPGHLTPKIDPNFKPYTTTLLKHPGGAAGQGPPPSEPPMMENQDQAEISIQDEEGSEISAEGDDAASDRIMKFAKLAVGPEFVDARA